VNGFDRPITISSRGHVSRGEYLPYAMARGYDPLYAFREIQGWFHDPDILVMNLEGPISGHGEKRSGASSLLSNHPAVLELARAGSHVVMNLGNNHTMDQGSWVWSVPFVSSEIAGFILSVRG
jgi:poly-gamma-glutamate capsule biosynthesis protein CapA/YwtB (metallophosphatase superfamily)